eukprot:TRINITY_DN2259_c0_g1_i1.p1 TRINITY_DN2259_c0_g1~~TRINITY_DN2259_c0_g1_i1.p1  ORF type:complete len:136 (-),score=8.01 TRINITY_DN2259_c0_g1_i1:444-851(-)
MNKVNVVSLLGSGSFGEVYLAKWRGIEVAAKVAKLNSEKLDFSSFENEAAILARVRHPNCVLFLKASLKPKPMILTEFVNGVTLFEFLHSQIAIKYKERIKIAQDIASALFYLHSCSPPILHRDIKSSNVLVYII